LCRRRALLVSSFFTTARRCYVPTLRSPPHTLQEGKVSSDHGVLESTNVGIIERLADGVMDQKMVGVSDEVAEGHQDGVNEGSGWDGYSEDSKAKAAAREGP
jgi:hypothetical protein